jgi:hypothetical protein
MDNPSPAPSPAEPKPKRSAKEVFQDFGVGTVLLAIWVVLCIKDGWFHPPDYQYVRFNRVMTYICIPLLIFCAIMAVSAGRTLWREKKQQPPPTPPPSA